MGQSEIKSVRKRTTTDNSCRLRTIFFLCFHSDLKVITDSYFSSSAFHSPSLSIFSDPHPIIPPHQTPTLSPCKRAPSSSPPSVGCPTARRCAGSTLRATAAARWSSNAAAACVCWARRPDMRWVRLPAAGCVCVCNVVGCSSWWRICSRSSCFLPTYQET